MTGRIWISRNINWRGRVTKCDIKNIKKYFNLGGHSRKQRVQKIPSSAIGN